MKKVPYLLRCNTFMSDCFKIEYPHSQTSRIELQYPAFGHSLMNCNTQLLDKPLESAKFHSNSMVKLYESCSNQDCDYPRCSFPRLHYDFWQVMIFLSKLQYWLITLKAMSCWSLLRFWHGLDIYRVQHQLKFSLLLSLGLLTSWQVCDYMLLACNFSCTDRMWRYMLLACNFRAQLFKASLA